MHHYTHDESANYKKINRVKTQKRGKSQKYGTPLTNYNQLIWQGNLLWIL